MILLAHNKGHDQTADAQANLGRYYWHMHKGTFSHGTTHILSSSKANLGLHCQHMHKGTFWRGATQKLKNVCLSFPWKQIFHSYLLKWLSFWERRYIYFLQDNSWRRRKLSPVFLNISMSSERKWPLCHKPAVNILLPFLRGNFCLLFVFWHIMPLLKMGLLCKERICSLW